MGGRDGLHLSSSSLASSSACRGMSEVGDKQITITATNNNNNNTFICVRYFITNKKGIFTNIQIYDYTTFAQEERRRLRDLRAEREARSLAIEKAYVHDVYEQVGTQEYLILNRSPKRLTKFRLQKNA